MKTVVSREPPALAESRDGFTVGDGRTQSFAPDTGVAAALQRRASARSQAQLHDMLNRRPTVVAQMKLAATLQRRASRTGLPGQRIADVEDAAAQAGDRARTSQAGRFASPGPAAPVAAAPVVQRVVTINDLLLRRAGELPGHDQLTGMQQQALNRMVTDRTRTYAFPTALAVVQYLTGAPNAAAPTITPIDAGDVEEARKRKRARQFDMATKQESTLAKHEAFEKIPKEQRYRLTGKRRWVENPYTKAPERRASKSEGAISGEELIEYVDPNDKTKENFVYRQGDQLLFSRVDPSSTANLSRAAAKNTPGKGGKKSGKTGYKDKRGGFKGPRKYGNKKAPQFARTTDDTTFVIGHSVAVKNMSTAKDPYGKNSDEQPKTFVPEDPTVGEHMKNPHLEPDDQPYVWENEYAPNPDKVYAGVPIPSHTQATIFKPGGTTVDFSVRMVNDSSVDYAAEREKYADSLLKAGKKPKTSAKKQTAAHLADVSYKDYMLANLKTAYTRPDLYDYETEQPMTPPIGDLPQTPEFLPEHLEEQDISSTIELPPAATHQVGGENWNVGWSTGKTGGQFGYKVDRTKLYQSDPSDLQAVTGFLAPPQPIVTSDPQQDQSATVPQDQLTAVAPQQDQSTIVATQGSAPMDTSASNLGVLSTDSSQMSSTDPSQISSTDSSQASVDPDPLGLLNDFILSDFSSSLSEDLLDISDLLKQLEEEERAEKERQERETRKQRQAGAAATGRRLRAGVPAQYQVALQAIDQVLNTLDNLDPGDVGTDQAVSDNLGRLRWIFDRIEGILQRPLTPEGGDPLGPTGSRLPVLVQFFAECGQMAAHNVLALANPANLDSYDHLLAVLHDETTLRTRGTFQNWIHEDAIRGQIAAGGRNDIPVVGHIGQMEAMMAATDDDLRNLWRMGPGRISEVAALRNFMNGASTEINLVVNTDAADDAPEGHHWITVRVERRDDGLRVFYADSYHGELDDYSALFARVKTMLGGR